ncbi:dihydrouridine synthase-domain-containing protein [Baffinella frigidus]|nr:dihydrouridine synthase-domain-containing protein [Cryptophyta sp. CCMP2293]
MGYTRRRRGPKPAEGGEGGEEDGAERRDRGKAVPDGVVLVSGKLGSRDATYKLAPASVDRPIAKLHGWAFWEAIGKPQHVCAPMVEASELAFRHLCRKYGTTLCYTPMIHARLFLEDEAYRLDAFGPDDGGEGDRPLIAQFCANDPETFLAAAQLLPPRVDAVDLNLGCPQGIAKRGNYGSFLMDDFALVFRLINTMHHNLGVPITAKIRVFESEEKTLQYAKCVQDAGAQVLTVHGRTRDEKGPEAPLADWDLIQKVKAHVSIPVISNGNVVSFDDIAACLQHTKADAVMSAEWLRRNPAIFYGGENVCLFKMAREYIALVRRYPAGNGVVKNHLFKMLSSNPGGFNEHGDLRERLAMCFGLDEMEVVFEELAERRGPEPSYPTATHQDLLPKSQKAPDPDKAKSARAGRSDRERKGREEEEEEELVVDIFSLEL